ncbi:MAG: hypothetical protein DRG78_11225 [Epsilonproteobacteria bacterium]|nr:MAG: hypothetical protein DRG78_11225 [Campylobacterota bacterium]
MISRVISRIDKGEKLTHLELDENFKACENMSGITPPTIDLGVDGDYYTLFKHREVTEAFDFNVILGYDEVNSIYVFSTGEVAGILPNGQTEYSNECNLIVINAGDKDSLQISFDNNEEQYGRILSIYDDQVELTSENFNGTVFELTFPRIFNKIISLNDVGMPCVFSMIIATNMVEHADYVKVLGQWKEFSLVSLVKDSDGKSPLMLETLAFAAEYADRVTGNEVNDTMIDGVPYTRQDQAWIPLPDIDGKDAVVLATAKTYTDDEIVILKDYTDTEVTAARAYTDTSIEATELYIDNEISSARAYTDTEVLASSVIDQAYTDSEVIIAKAYTDSEVIIAKAYTDTADTNNSTRDQAYTDTADTNNSTRDQAYTDSEVSALKSYSDLAFEPIDATILKDADISVTVQAYDALYVRTEESFTTGEKTKLAALVSSHYKGIFTNLPNLQAVTDGIEGDYADVDGGVGQEVTRYVWDENDSVWMEQAGASSALTDEQVKTQYENNADTNVLSDAMKTDVLNIDQVFSSAEQAKLITVEDNANNYTLPFDVVQDSDYNHSDENYSTAEQSKLAGMDANANNYVLPADVVQDASYVQTENDYTNVEKAKLNLIESNANNYTLPSDVVQDGSYVATQESFTTVEQVKLAAIEAAANNYVLPADVVQDASYVATEVNYSSVDKSKLDAIDAGANAYVLPADVVQDSSYVATQESYTTFEKDKLASMEGSHYKGTYLTLQQLIDNNSGSVPGDYGDVDADAGDEVKRYVWDNNDVTWVQQLGEAAILTDEQVKAQYENNADTNNFDDAEKAKLITIEDNATADQTNVEIKAAYESNANTNNFDDAAVSKLAGVDTGAKDDQTGAEIKTAYQAEINAYNDTLNIKLVGIEESANNYSLPGDVVIDASYVATEESYTTVEKTAAASVINRVRNFIDLDFVATDGQTTFVLTDVVVASVQVFDEGTKIKSISDFTISDDGTDTTIEFTVGRTLNAWICITYID